MKDHNDHEYDVGFILATPVDRLIAFFIDGLIVTLLSLTIVGSIIGLVYFLTRDSLPIFDGQSLGKKIMNLKVLDDESNQTIKNNYSKSLLRNIPLLIPVFQFIDAFMVFSTNGKRFGDQWAKTYVIKGV